MDVITKVLDEYIDIPPNHFVFDIETTGLSPKYCSVILIGVLFNENNKTIVKQFFAEDESEEEELLLTFINQISIFKNHITFNGIAFDIPFLNSRFKKYNIDFYLDNSYDIDILRLVKPFKEKLLLSDCKLKTIEKYMGIYREDTISGKESIDMYKEYVSCKSTDLKSKILLHNYEDIYHLGHLLKIQNILEDKLNLICIESTSLSFKIFPHSYKFSNNKLTLKYSIFSGKPCSISIYSDNYNIFSDKDSIFLTISINKGRDSKNNSILFYRMSKIIPLKVNSNPLEDNIYNLCNYLIQKELKSL